MALGGCAPPKGEQQAPPPPAVTVAAPVEREVIQWDQYTGYIEAPDQVDVEARVSGEIISATFVEGSLVKRGQTLFKIDARPYQATYDQLLATQQKDATAVVLARLDFQRYQQALASNAVSKQTYDNAKATLEQAAATVESDKAAVRNAELNLQWCNVIAPIDGRVSYKLVTPGNLIIAGGGQAPATLLTTIQSVNPIYCYVDVDENSALRYRKLQAENKMLLAPNGQVPAYLQLGDETGFPHAGYLDFFNNKIDAATGTLRVRAIFSNDQGTLVPGFFACMRVPGSARYKTLLVPDAAIGADQNQTFLLVIGPEDTVVVKPVQLGPLFGSLRSIVSGIDPSDHVITDGLLHARPGSKVQPVMKPIELSASDFADPDSMPIPEPATQKVEDTAATEPAIPDADRSAPATAPDKNTMTGAGPTTDSLGDAGPSAATTQSDALINSTTEPTTAPAMGANP